MIMINAIISASLRDRFMVIIGTLIIALVGLYSYKNAPLDAIPDLSDVQVIIFTEFPGQSPQVVEDQVTYPLTTSMLASSSAAMPPPSTLSSGSALPITTRSTPAAMRASVQGGVSP